MSGIRLPVIAPLVLVALSKCAKDPSSYVRKCAANALPKLNDLHQEENVPALEELANILLNDHSPGVVGAAAAAFKSICPNNLSLVGRRFKRLCEMLPDVDEWGQIALIDILLRYVVVRHGLVEESIMLSSHHIETFHGKKEIFGSLSASNGPVLTEVERFEPKLSALMFRYYIQGSDEYLSTPIDTKRDDSGSYSLILTSTENSDVKLLLQCTSPLLWSQNTSVVLAAAGVHWILASQKDVDRIVKPILFILRSSYPSRYVVLRNVQVFAKAAPFLFAPYYEDFFVSSSDSYQMRALKLEILSTIATASSIPFILQEFQDYIKDPDRRFAVDAVAAIALCALKLPSVAKTCLEGLLALINQESSISHHGSIEGEAGVLVQAIISVKAIIKPDPAKYEKVIVHLIRNLDKVNEPTARALIIWIVGEYSYVGQLMLKIVPVVLSHLARHFTSEELEGKYQILNASAKVVLCAQGEELQLFRKLLCYIVELAKFDSNYDIRDRARMIEKLLISQVTISLEEKGSLRVEPNSELLRDKLVKHMFCEKIQSLSYSLNNLRLYLPGSLSQIVLHAAPGYTPLPKPCTLPEMAPEKRISQDGTVDSNSEDVTEPVMLSGSSIEGSHSDYDSEGSFISSADGGKPHSVSDSDDAAHNTVTGALDASATSLLIHHTDARVHHGMMSQSIEKNDVAPVTTDLANLVSKTSLESWLNEPGLPSANMSAGSSGEQASARISVNEIGITVRPKVHALLEPENGNGLRVGYIFPSETSNISPFLVCVAVFFENFSSEALNKIIIRDEGSSENPEFVNRTSGTCDSVVDPSHVPAIVPMEEIASLNPGDTARRILQVRFHHHLLPLKLAVFCNEKRHPIKLQPDIGYFVRPLPMDMDSFVKKECQLRGMFEYTRRCTFTDHVEPVGHEKNEDSLSDDKILVICQKTASKMLSNANIHLVSVDMPVSLKFDEVSGLCLRFSSEILSSSKPCLITLLAEGKCSEPLDISVKVNCEETVFGLNLLNRIVAFLASNVAST
uniref:AP3-complex subunit beta-A n=2 Tax=Anthurium amnicola TaxID=1678845 RepID=A0A1D1XM21_9ARAE